MLRLRLLPLLCALGLLAPAPAHAAPEPGINLSLPFTQTDLQNVKDSGAKTARFFMFTTNDPSQFDGPVAQLAAIGVKPVFVIVGDGANPPKTPSAVADYAAFAGRAALHFRGQVAGWEIWNEEDAPKWWAGMPQLDEDHPNRDASLYVPLLKASYAAIKAVDATTPVVIGGLTGNDYKFVQSVYDNGGGGSFDAVADHTDTACAVGSPYGYYRDTPGGPISQWAFLGYRSVHDVMAAHGDGHKSIWLTEMCWSSYTGPCASGKLAGQKPSGVSEADQATFTTQAFHCLAGDAYVTKVMLFKLDEDGNPDPMENAYGAVRANGQRKAVFGALQTYATLGDTRPAGEACGDFQGPDITISAPTDGAVFAAALPISVSASDASGVPRISLYIDGSQTVIRNFTDKNAPGTLKGSMTWQGAKRLSVGTHKLTITAVDPSGNVGTKTVTITKLDPRKLKAVPTSLRVTLGGSGGKRVVKVSIVRGGAGLTNVLGKLQVVFQKKVKGRWIAAHKYGRSAKGVDRHAATFSASLNRAQWRVLVVYTTKPGTSFGSAKAISKAFSVR